MPLRLMAYRSDLKSGAVLIFSSQCSCCGVTGGLGSSPRAASKSPGSLAALPRRSPSYSLRVERRGVPGLLDLLGDPLPEPLGLEHRGVLVPLRLDERPGAAKLRLTARGPGPHSALRSTVGSASG
jgi:hypothetical protein